MWGRGSRRAPAATPGSSSWAIARATAPRWLGSNCWVSDGAAGAEGGGQRGGEGGPGSPFSLGRLRDAVRLEAARAHPQPPRRAVYDGSHALPGRVPAPVRLIVRVADVVPHHGALATDVAHSSHGIHPTEE